MLVTKDMIDPELRLPGAIVSRLFGRERTVDQLRSGDVGFLKVLRRLPSPGVRKTEVSLPRPDGTELRLLVVSPLTLRQDAPTVLWIHSGGYAQGSPDAEVSSMKAL
ncbi:MAG: hypothetical protein M3N46_09560, partial [Actinomycetota bacterium]|nr:hypothetical protein [Actinomycetota bacterium]